jgi:hypothetical protein
MNCFLEVEIDLNKKAPYCGAFLYYTFDLY